jgi:hypothetical protein
MLFVLIIITIILIFIIISKYKIKSFYYDTKQLPNSLNSSYNKSHPFITQSLLGFILPNEWFPWWNSSNYGVRRSTRNMSYDLRGDIYPIYPY